jgi:SAM-dependent methyltransferase
MSGLTFSSDAAEQLIAAYRSADMLRQREAVLHRLSLRGGDHVIDVGCGPGFLCESMAQAVGPTGRVVGVDISEDLIAFATSHKAGNCIEYRIGNATSLPVDAGRFDVAVSTQVMEYVSDADLALRELARVVRPGGRVLIVDTDFGSWVWHASNRERMAQLMKGWELHCADSELPRKLIPRLRAVGFTTTSVEGYPIVNTTYRPGDFCHGLSILIANFLRGRGFEADVAQGWLADLSEQEERGESFFSLNRYFFTATKVD